MSLKILNRKKDCPANTGPAILGSHPANPGRHHQPEGCCVNTIGKVTSCFSVRELIEQNESSKSVTVFIT